MSDRLTIRGHHLLCMLTYVGKGYTADFVANMTQVVQRIGAGEAFAVVAERDSICHGLSVPGACHCDDPQVAKMDALAIAAVNAALPQPVAVATRRFLTAGDILTLRQRFKAGSLRPACQGCSWQSLCTEVARQNYAGALLAPPPEPPRPTCG